MEELKPCPFCGDNGIYDTNGKSYWVICAGCGARVAGTYFSGEKGKKIITERWNKRTFTQGHEKEHFADVSKKERTVTHACDLISRQAAIDRINKQREHLQPNIYEQDYIGDAAYKICAEFIERLPSTQPKRGKWIDDGQYADYFPHHAWLCSECGDGVIEVGTPGYNFCPNCGAQMEKGEDDD